MWKRVHMAGMTEPNMSNYLIRLYQDSDYNAVRELFAEGTLEHTQVAFKHGLSLIHIRLFLLAVFFVPFITIGSLTLSCIVFLLVFTGMWFGTKDLYASYVRHALSNDMLDIQKYYLQKDGYCFWVAESLGEVIGMVVAIPSAHPGGENHIELRRMSVAKNHRGRGIAKSLCRTVIDFARERGCSAVVLETTLGHQAAHGLYKSMGFKWQHSTFLKHPLAKFVDFKFFFYKYDIPTSK
ncbi:N-acetyltransferase 8-like isoform X2 [Pyxicephalus adspersus]|uniref:N-acetyltransferase 8-like isoform X2 n=1 Tax=Pyxicephalus adspersus TaxID=30357 RepID=UPI003B58D602